MLDPPPSRRRVVVLTVMWALAPLVPGGLLAERAGQPFWVGVVVTYYLPLFAAGCVVLLGPGDDDAPPPADPGAP